MKTSASYKTFQVILKPKYINLTVVGNANLLMASLANSTNKIADGEILDGFMLHDIWPH